MYPLLHTCACTHMKMSKPNWSFKRAIRPAACRFNCQASVSRQLSDISSCIHYKPDSLLKLDSNLLESKDGSSQLGCHCQGVFFAISHFNVHPHGLYFKVCMSGCYSQVSSAVTCEIADSVATASLQIQPCVVEVCLNQ